MLSLATRFACSLGWEGWLFFSQWGVLIESWSCVMCISPWKEKEWSWKQGGSPRNGLLFAGTWITSGTTDLGKVAKCQHGLLDGQDFGLMRKRVCNLGMTIYKAALAGVSKDFARTCTKVLDECETWCFGRLQARSTLSSNSNSLSSPFPTSRLLSPSCCTSVSSAPTEPWSKSKAWKREDCRWTYIQDYWMECVTEFCRPNNPGGLKSCCHSLELTSY